MRWGIRSAAALVALAMALSLGLTSWTPPSAQASIKAGKPCPAVGKQVVKPKWTFTCKVRKGKKVWVRTARPVWERVASEILASADKRSAPVPADAFNVVTSPSVSAAVAQRVTDSVRWSYQPWQALAPIPPGYPLVIVDGASREWFLSFSAQLGNDNCGPGWWERTEALPWVTWGAVCTMDDPSGGGSSYLVYRLGSGMTAIADQLALHESVHVAQALLLSETVFSRSSECWLGEGMAELYTGALLRSRESDALVVDSSRAFRWRVIRALAVLEAGTDEVSDPAYWLDVIRRSESRGSELCTRNSLGYSLGYLVSEKLVADFGESGLLRWLSESRNMQDPDGAFLTVFGVDQDRWYETSAAPYVAREATKILAD